MKNRNIISIMIVTIISLIIVNCSSNESKEKTFNIYLIAYEGSALSGKSIGCNDILVPTKKTVTIEKNEIETALHELFSAKDTEELKNFIKGPALLLYQVTIANGVADVYLKGDFNISGVCDIPRIKEQLYSTAKQFSDIKEVKFFINNETLEAYLSLTSKGFN